MKRAHIVVVVALTLAGCGHGTPAISNDASKALQAKVAQIRISASARDATAATAELAELRTQVAELRRNGELSEAAAQKILDAAVVVDQNLSLITTTTTTTTTTSPPSRGKGKGKGDGGGGGGD